MNNFEAMSTMAKTDKDIRMAPLSNIVEMKKTKNGCKLTIMVENELMDKIALNKLTGGLYLMDKEQFFEVMKDNYKP